MKFPGGFMGFKLKSVALFGVLLLSGCGQASVSCSDDDAKSALEAAIRENLEKVTIDRAKAEDGSQPISNSAIRASIANIKLVIENIRTTKEDPDSTKRFCTGSLKIVFSTKTFSDATKARELVGLSDVEKMADAADIEKGADYLKGDLDYNVQPTDDGEKIYAEFENADDKLQVFGEVVAASLLKSSIETQVRNQKEQEEFALAEQEAAIEMEKTANLQQANEAAKSSDQALNIAWQSLGPNTRKQLLAQQRIWIKQKDASCKVRGLQSSTDASEQKIAEVLCKAELSNQRANQLQGYYREEYSAEEVRQETESY
jgi:uncharacterized protein YecT (DUF1311 family)